MAASEPTGFQARAVAPAVSGWRVAPVPATVEAAFDFRAPYNATAATMTTVALKNQQDAMEYA